MTFMQPEENSPSSRSLLTRTLPILILVALAISYFSFKYLTTPSNLSGSQSMVDETFTFTNEPPAILKNEFSKHKLTIVHFWASWCPPCIEELPRLVKFHDTYRDRGVEILAVNTDEEDSLSHIERFRRNYKWNFKDVTDVTGAIYRASGYESLPATVIYSQSGAVLFSQAGDVDWSYDRFTKQVEEWLK